MTPEQRIAQLEAQVAELMKWKEERTARQLVFPLDETSVKALNNTLRTTKFDRIYVQDIFFTPSDSNAEKAGQMRFRNSGGTEEFEGCKNFGTSLTFTLS
jgi:hypothetical protein